MANGYLGMRGNSSEGRDAHEHGTFINGFHEVWPIRHAEQAFGFAEVGQTIVNVPDTKIIRLYVDDEPLVLDVAELLTFERELDFREGLLRRELLWLTPSGKRVRVKSDRMVSFVERHLAVMSFEVTVEKRRRHGRALQPDPEPPGRRGRVRPHDPRHAGLDRVRPAPGGAAGGARAAAGRVLAAGRPERAELPRHPLPHDDVRGHRPHRGDRERGAHAPLDRPRTSRRTSTRSARRPVSRPS